MSGVCWLLLASVLLIVLGEPLGLLLLAGLVLVTAGVFARGFWQVYRAVRES